MAAPSATLTGAHRPPLRGGATR